MADKFVGVPVDAPMADRPRAINSVLTDGVEYSGIAEGARAFGAGVSFGLLEELEAALRTGAISGPEYERQRDQLRAQQQQFGMDMPIVKTGLEIGGSLVLPFGAAKQVTRLAPATQAAITGTTKAGIAGRVTAVGAGTGAASGYGFAEENAGSEAVSGGIFGGLLGLTVPVVAERAGTLIKNVLTSAGVGDQQTATSKILASALQKDNLTPDEAIQALEELRRLGVPNPTIADLGKSLNDLAYSAYAVQSKAKGKTQEFLENRLIDQPNDIVRGLVEKAGLAQNVNGFEYLEALTTNQARLASLSYPEAYSRAINAVPFRQYVDRPVFQKAYQEAVKRAGVFGNTLPDLSAIRNAQSVPTDVLHKIKIGLDDIINAETDLTGKMTGYGGDVVKVKNEFNDLIKSLNPEYAKANAEFADAERIAKAFKMGESYQKLDPKEAASKIRKLNPDEKEAFRLGVMADVNSRVGDFKGGDFTRQIFKSDNQKLLLRNAFPDQESYTEFSQFVKGLEKQSKTSKRILGNSRTDENKAVREQADFLGNVAQAAASPDPVSSSLRLAGQSLLSRAKGISEQSSEELQRRLFSVDRIEQTAILNELNRRMKRPQTGLLTGAAVTGSATGILGD